MATVITEACINCGACEPECPNTAIYQGGVEWELDGQNHKAISDAIFYIVPEKCTECVGFFDHEACAAVCPVDCCVPDPQIPETEGVLIERAKKLHPDTDFPPEFPSRFRKVEEPAPAAEAAVAAPVADAGAYVASGDEFTVPIPDLDEWDIPIVCFRCQGEYAVPYRHFHPGTVFYCPHCDGSFVPTLTICEKVAGGLRRFYDSWLEAFDQFRERRQRELDTFEEQQRTRLVEFDKQLRTLTRGLQPPGAPRRKSLWG
jgi:ferredoxin